MYFAFDSNTGDTLSSVTSGVFADDTRYVRLNATFYTWTCSVMTKGMLVAMCSL